MQFYYCQTDEGLMILEKQPIAGSTKLARGYIMGKSNEDWQIIPTADALPFQFRVRYSATKDIHPHGGPYVHATTVVAGFLCDLLCCPLTSDEGWLKLILSVSPRLNETFEGIKVIANMVLLDKTGSPSYSGVDEGTLADGFRLSVRREHLEKNCVVDGYFVAQCSVAIIKDWPPPPHTIIPDLCHDLAKMWNQQDLTDVSFSVDGVTFSAHRLVLAARSPVFRAELYGQMAESKMASIAIQDMRASTFASMLHYMYHDSLPSPDDEFFTSHDIQHLLVAADRYGLEMLQQACEERLCFRIAVDTVCSTLELAEENTYPRLKSRCLDFLTDAKILSMVATPDEYIHLAHSFPSLFVEVRERFKEKCEGQRWFPIKSPVVKKRKRHGR
ncbi:BTB/POZ and MATH domain-containing protein 1-like [Lolium perenne]|uniref:BTB/POZ and MATH domain-containing protein 1-like n=1 Tax=Lolium perenne TaxID=4522 RepID=UPI0021F5EC34|nr:BTB/POZ and MATH domain-containing protein 1-like [Lolium perenne]